MGGPGSAAAQAMATHVVYLLMTAALSRTSVGELWPPGVGDVSRCAPTSSWYRAIHDVIADCDSPAATELKLNTSAVAPSAAFDGNSSSTNETCFRHRSSSFQTFVGRVIVVGKLFNDTTLTSCLPLMSDVVLRQAEIGLLTGDVVNSVGTSGLQRLDLADNGVTELAPGSFDGRRLSRLEHIDLSRNSLTAIDNETFIDLFAIRLINLSQNAIYRLERAAFITMTQLHQHANTTDTDTSSLDPATAAGPEGISSRVETDAWPAVETIDLSHNIINELDELIFRGPLSNIRNLLLSYNRISSLPRYIVDQLHHLVSIDLAHNELVWLDVGAFSSASLRYVDLSHNSLRKLVSMTFLYLPAIVHIDLSNNKINQIYKYAFYRLCKSDDSDDPQSRDSVRQVNITLRSNRLESDVIFQMMTLFDQQQGADGLSGCSLRTDLRDNHIQHFLDPGAAIHLRRQDSGRQQQDAVGVSGSELYVDLDGNDIECDCRLVADLHTLDKVAATSRPSIASNPLAWRSLNCSGPELFAGFTVSEFAAYSLCPTNDNDAHLGHVTDTGNADLSDSAPQRRIRVTAGNRSILLPAINQANSAVDPMSVLTDADDKWRHHAAAFSGSHAAIIALLLCAAALALLGGLLFKRGGGGVGSSAAAGASRRMNTAGARRRQCEVFVVYGVDDEAWVTGTLLELVYARYPRYGVLLQHHVDPACDSWYSHRKRSRRGGDNDGRWSRAQLVLNSCMDNCLMTVVVVSRSFFSSVWNLDSFRSLMLSKFDSQRHRFLLICLDNDVITDDTPANRKQFFDSSSVYPRLSVTDRHFADRLIDYLPPGIRQRSDSIDTEESVALISEDGGCQNERY